MADTDSGGELRVLDKQLLKSEASTHTPAKAWSTAEKCFDWWLWMLREQKDRDEPNPIRRDGDI